MMSNQTKRITLKICLCGRYGVGKSSLRRNYMGDARFKRNYLPTIGSDFSLKDVHFQDQTVRLLIWDLAGESRFRRFRSLYFQGSHGAIVVFDLTDRDSFYSMKEWINDLKNYTETKGVPFLILGNKVDLVLSEIEQDISDDEINSFIEELNKEYSDKFNIEFLKTSALSGDNVEKSFNNLIENIMNWLERRNIIIENNKDKI